jgi:membrane dipeptidase
LESATDIINIARGLADRGYSEIDIKKILGENFLRLFEEVWGE